MQLVVVMAVRKAVSAATTTFTAISIKRFFIIKSLTSYLLLLTSKRGWGLSHDLWSSLLTLGRY